MVNYRQSYHIIGANAYCFIVIKNTPQDILGGVFLLQLLAHCHIELYKCLPIIHFAQISLIILFNSAHQWTVIVNGTKIGAFIKVMTNTISPVQKKRFVRFYRHCDSTARKQCKERVYRSSNPTLIVVINNLFCFKNIALGIAQHIALFIQNSNIKHCFN